MLRPEPKFPLKTPKAQTPVAPPSVWLYLAGLCVTLTGLYAVWSDVRSGLCRVATFLLAALGCGFSYLARRRQFSTAPLRTAALGGIVSLTVYALATHTNLDGLLPADALNDRSKACLILIAWGATLLTFLLGSDAAVLFCCVPSMSMIALVSTLSPDAPMQNVFLVFVGAATFLMVHENYLRTQSGAAPVTTAAAQRLLRGQMQLAALCVFGSLTLAMLAVAPIRMIGQRLFMPSAIAALKNGQNAAHPLSSLNGSAERSDVLDIATGPVSPEDQLVMRIQAPDGLYWRGATFDRYTGSSFINSEKRESVHLTPTLAADGTVILGATLTGDQMASETPPAQFDVYPRWEENPLEIPDDAMRCSREITQTVTMENQTARQIYGAGRIKRVWIPEDQLDHNMAGSLSLITPPPRGRIYTIRSRIPDTNPVDLQAASSRIRDIPSEIQQRYLQVDIDTSRFCGHSAWLQDRAREITKGCANNYDRAAAIQTYISRNCKYNLQAARAPRDQDIVEYFLRDSKEGYCDSFAAAMTMLCRYAGVPARLATGFIAGDYDPASHTYTVREKHRHAWTEVFFPRIGWVTFDATEGASDISDYPAKAGRKRQNFWQWLLSSGAAPPALGLACVGILGLIVRNEWRDRKKRAPRLKDRRTVRAIRDRKISASYAAACLALKRRGLTRLPTQTPDEYAAQVLTRTGAELPELAAPLTALTALYAASCYAPRALSEAETAQAKDKAAQIAKILRQAKRIDFAPAPSPHSGSGEADGARAKRPEAR